MKNLWEYIHNVMAKSSHGLCAEQNPEQK